MAAHGSHIDSAETPMSNQDRILQAIEHAAHLLPSQGPISIFVHHNTLHAFEEQGFDDAVKQGWTLFGCQPFLSEARYRDELSQGRIELEDVRAVLLDELGDRSDFLVGFMGTRYHFRLAMLEHPFLVGSDSEIEWQAAETLALTRFRPEAPAAVRVRMTERTRQWFLNRMNSADDGYAFTSIAAQVQRDFGDLHRASSWNDDQWEAVTLHLMWQLCRKGVSSAMDHLDANQRNHANHSLQSPPTVFDSFANASMNNWLIRFVSAFLDQGFAGWPLPNRDQGLFRSFLSLATALPDADPWMQGLGREAKRLQSLGMSASASIEESLLAQNVSVGNWDKRILEALLALRGWAGMIWQMETNAAWTVRPAPRGSLVDYTAIRLLLERVAANNSSKYKANGGANCSERNNNSNNARCVLTPNGQIASVNQLVYMLFQLAQVRGWSPQELFALSGPDWSRLIDELQAFDDIERRRIYHLAYERRYRIRTLDALTARPYTPISRSEHLAKFQVITCIDDREESFRRHLEEIEPECRTFGAPGFFAVPMYYKGAGDAHFRPLCPVVITPSHYVREKAAYSLGASSRQRATARRRIGAAQRHWHLLSRSLLGGVFTSFVGAFASIPLVARVLFPRFTANLASLFGSITQPPPVTELMLDRMVEPPSPEDGHAGFSIAEKAASVERLLRDVGLTSNFSPIVILLGHGSGSLNNPHESAYDCGACSGGRGGPNARAFAHMANQYEVRELLKSRGLDIPKSTSFVGGFHNTCDDDLIFFDLDELPFQSRPLFEAARDALDAARMRNAHERCRRFESASSALTYAQALDHVQTRAEDLSQARPEYNHATNSVCFVGRRQRTRGLYLDRRTFLTEYDPTQDDEKQGILARILAAAIPVCAGISLEYYFSCVDSAGYGCGSKLPHNIASLLGVMEGATSDLRTGLSQQMIEIHEPLRILFVVETTPEAMERIINANSTIETLVKGRWVQLAVLSPNDNSCQVYDDGRFSPYERGDTPLPKVTNSREWYHGKRGHLPYAEIIPQGAGGAQ